MLSLLINLIQRHLINRLLTAVISAATAAGGVLLARVPRPITLLMAVVLIAGAVWAFSKAIQRNVSRGY